MQLKQNPFSPFFYSTFLQWTVELLKTACERPLTAQTPSLYSLVNSNRPQRRWRVRLWSVYGVVCAYFCWLFLRSAPWLDLARSALLRQTSPGGGGGKKHSRSAQECRRIGTWLSPGSIHTLSLFPLSAETPRGAYLRKHSIPLCAIKQYSKVTTQPVQTCNSQTNRSVSAWKLESC